MNDRDPEENQNDDKKRVVIEFDRPGKPAAESPENLNTPEAASVAGEEGSVITDQLARMQAEKEDLVQTMVRRQADFENYRKRIERGREEESRRGVARLIDELIPVLDAFERALKAHDDPAYEEYRKGLELIYRQLWDTLARQGLERIPAAGATFDPHFHQAIERVETNEHPDGAILEVFQDGFMFYGRVLRPSIVRVAINTESSSGQSATLAN
jgi:molecular chaperone GrpE